MISATKLNNSNSNISEIIQGFITNVQIYKLNMNIESHQQNVLRSSITLIPFKPNLSQMDHTGFFKDIFAKNQMFNENSLDSEIKFIYENETPLYGSLFGKMYDQSYQGIENGSQQLIWVKSQEQIGFSESEVDSQQIQIRSTNSQQQGIIQKHKPISKSKYHAQSLQEQNETEASLQAKRFQNETKNIPKNFGKAIIAFAIKHFNDFRHLPEFKEIQFQDFKKELVAKRKQITTISSLKSMWVNFRCAKCMRVLSNLFLRRYSLSYIFNSKVSNISPHVKYRYKLLEGIKSPMTFSSIKDF